MGFVGLLQFSLKCFDVLAWPLVALVYPLCASVWAIETNSNYHLRKLGTYWVLFSLISLFELAFLRVIEWLPFWPQIKLIFVCLLVIPRFNGAYYVYKSLVHLCLSVDLQAVVEWLNKPKDEVSLKSETFLSVAETYVQKNGTEALEKLIANKSKDSNSNLIVEEIKSVANAEEKEVATTIQFNEPNIVQKDVKTVEPKNKIAAAAAVKSCKEPNIVQKDVKAVEPPEKNAAAAAKRAEKKAAAAVEVQEMTEPAARNEDKLPEPPAKVQKEWTCAVCQVITTCEVDLNRHLQGQKHRATLDEFKASKQAAKNRGSSCLTPNKSDQAKKESIKCVSGDKPNKYIPLFKRNKYKTAEQEVKVPVNSSNSEQFKQINTNTSTCPGDIDVAAHLNGGKHLSRIQEMFNPVGGQSGWDYAGGSSGWDYAGGSSGWDNAGGSLGWDYAGGPSGWDYAGGSVRGGSRQFGRGGSRQFGRGGSRQFGA